MRLIPNWLRDNFRVKLGIFLFAALLWFLVVTEKNYEYTIDTPITVVGVKSGKIITRPIPETARVRYHGRGRELLRMIYFAKPHLTLDFTTISQFYTFKLRPDMVTFPAGINTTVIEIIEPDSIPVVLDERAHIKIPVSADIDITPSPGYVISQIDIQPASVDVRGPKRTINELRKIKTEHFQTDNAKRNTDYLLNLIPPDHYAVSISPSQVKVSVRFDKIAEKTVRYIPVKIINRPPGRDVFIEPPTVDIRLTGAVNTLAEFDAGDIDVYVDCTEFDPVRGGSVNVKVKTDSLIEVAEITPPKVKMILRRH